MPTSYTSLLGLALPVTGELSGTWGQTVNDSITALLDSAVAGTTTLSTDADVTLTTTDGAANQARSAVLLCSGARTALRTITAPARSKAYVIINDTTGGFGVKIVGVGPTTGVTVPAGTRALVAWNGSDFVRVSSSAVAATDLTGVVPTASGGTNLSSFTTNGAMYATSASALTTGTLPTASGGTGLTTFNTNGAVYATSTSALTTGTLPVAGGGTGQTSFTDGQLLIGNSTGNTLAKATLTAGSGVTITNGPGSITINAAGTGGTVQTVSVNSANGFAGTVATATTTPAITLSTSINGMLKGNGTALQAASSGTDFAPAAPLTTSLLKGNNAGGFNIASSGTDYAPATPATAGNTLLAGDNFGGFNNVTVGSGLSLSGGTLTSTGSGGSVTTVSVNSANGFAGTVATATTTPAITLTTSITGLLKGNGTALQAASSGSDYAPAAPLTTSLLKGNNAGGFNIASSGTDYAPATPATAGNTLLAGNNFGGFNNVTVGSGLSLSGGTLTASGGTGTVTQVAQTFTGGLISVTGSPINTSGTLALSVAGTSGGVPYFSSSSAWASSGTLAANALMVGGGVGGSPATTTTGTGVLTALGTNVGTAGSFVTNGGALGTPSSGTVTNLTGTASININGTVGATTPSTGAFTSVVSTSGSGVVTRAAGAQDGVALVGRAGGTSSFTSTLTPTTLTASRTLTLPDNSGTILTTGALVTVSQGGTGLSTLPQNNLLLGNGTSNPQWISPGAAGNVLTSTGLTWVSQALSTGATLISNGSWYGATGVTISGISSTYKYYMLVINNWNNGIWAGTGFYPYLQVVTTTGNPDTNNSYFSQSSTFSTATGYASGAASGQAILSAGAYGAAATSGHGLTLFIDAKYAVTGYSSQYIIQGSVLGGAPTAAASVIGHFGWTSYVGAVTGLYLFGAYASEGTYYLYGFNSP